MSTPNRERFGRPWTQTEDDLLLEATTPSKRAELSQLLDRTADAIQVRWVRLRKRQRAKEIANVIEQDQAAQQNLPLIPAPPTPTRRQRRPSVIRRLDNRKPGSHYSDEVRRKALAIAAQGVAPGIVDRTLRIGKGCTRVWMNEAGQRGKPPTKLRPASPPSPSMAATASTPQPTTPAAPTPQPPKTGGLQEFGRLFREGLHGPDVRELGQSQPLLSLTGVDTTVQSGRDGASVMAIHGIADIELTLNADGPFLHVRLR